MRLECVPESRREYGDGARPIMYRVLKRFFVGTKTIAYLVRKKTNCLTSIGLQKLTNIFAHSPEIAEEI